MKSTLRLFACISASLAMLTSFVGCFAYTGVTEVSYKNTTSAPEAVNPPTHSAGQPALFVVPISADPADVITELESMSVNGECRAVDGMSSTNYDVAIILCSNNDSHPQSSMLAEYALWCSEEAWWNVGGGIKYCNDNIYFTVIDKLSGNISIHNLGEIESNIEGEWFSEHRAIAVSNITDTSVGGIAAVAVDWTVVTEISQAVGDGESEETNTAEQYTFIVSATGEIYVD